MDTKIFNPDKKPAGYYANSRVEMFEFIPQGISKVLEVGCGVGVFGGCLKTERKAEVWGIDICKKAAEEAKEKLDRVIVGDMENEELNLPKNYFDCIIFNDVLEHMKYPWLVLKKIKENLINSGYVVASIPNARYYYHIYDLLRYKKWEYENQGILDVTHLRFFTIESIKDMFDRCGYQMIKIKGINSCKVSWKFELFNWLMKRSLEDMKFLQFVCVAQKLRNNDGHI